MLDIRKIDQDPETFQSRLAARGSDLSLSEVTTLSKRRRELIVRTEELRHQKSATESSMKTADKKGPEFATFRDQMRELSKEIKELAHTLKDVEEQLNAAVLQIPNLPDEDPFKPLLEATSQQNPGARPDFKEILDLYLPVIRQNLEGE